MPSDTQLLAVPGNFIDSQNYLALSDQSNAVSPYEQSPIHRLHNIVLRVIFWIDADHSRPLYRQKNVQRSWIRLGHVCTLWRAIILDMPALWARDFLAFGVERALSDILPRARNVPLDLHCNLMMPSGTLAQISQLIPRAKLLTCTTITPEDKQAVENLVLFRPLPLLQTLTVQSLEGCRVRELEKVDHGQLLAGLHNLRELDLDGVYWRPPLSGHLVSLSIRTKTTGPAVRVLLSDVLNVLSHNLALEHLQLNLAFSEHDIRTLQPSIILPELVSLTLAFDTIRTAPSLFYLLRMKALKTLHISERSTARLNTETLIKLVDTLSVCGTMFVTPLPPKVTLTVNQYERKLAFCLDFHHDKPREEQSLVIHAPFESAVIGRTAGFELLSTVVQCLSDAQIFSRVQKLRWCIRFKAQHITPCWNSVFPFFTSVKEFIWIKITDRTAVALASLACTDSDGQLYLPNLDRIVALCYPDFYAVVRAHRGLQETLRQRARFGAPVSEARVSVMIEDERAAVARDMEKCAKELGVELADMRRSSDRLEWFVKAEA